MRLHTAFVRLARWGPGFLSVSSAVLPVTSWTKRHFPVLLDGGDIYEHRKEYANSRRRKKPMELFPMGFFRGRIGYYLHSWVDKGQNGMTCRKGRGMVRKADARCAVESLNAGHPVFASPTGHAECSRQCLHIVVFYGADAGRSAGSYGAPSVSSIPGFSWIRPIRSSSAEGKPATTDPGISMVQDPGRAPPSRATDDTKESRHG